MIKKLVLVATISVTLGVAAQTAIVRISPEEASNRLVNASRPIYPPLAEQARIQGNVILQVRIGEDGSASVLGVVSGHPMLTQAAVNAVNRYKYKPVDIDGKPRAAMTLVMVRFGNPGKSNEARDQARIKFEHESWTLREAAEYALAKNETAAAEQLLQKLKDLSPPSDGDSAPWLLLMGRLREAQNKLDEAEQYYKRALEIEPATYLKDSPLLASTLANLGDLYAKQNRNDLARENLSKALAISQKNFKNATRDNQLARANFGQVIVREAWALSKLAVQRNDTQEAKAQCHTALEFQSFVSATDRDSLVSFCSGLESPAPSK